MSAYQEIIQIIRQPAGGDLSAEAAGDGLGYTNGVLSVKVGNGVEVNSDTIAVKIDSAEFQFNSGSLQIKQINGGTF